MDMAMDMVVGVGGSLGLCVLLYFLNVLKCLCSVCHHCTGSIWAGRVHLH